MSLRSQILSDIKGAMKSRDQVTLVSLRFLNSVIKNQEIEIRPRELADEDVIKVIKKLVKQGKDSIEQFEKGGRTDLVNEEKAKLAAIEVYLPQPLSREKVEAIVAEVMASLNVTSMGQMGAVMKEVISQTAGQADNKMISEIVKTQLQSLCS